MAYAHWDQTELYKRIEERAESDSENTSAKTAIRILGNLAKPVLTVLREGSNATQSFTLHDDEHGSRVARRMAELIPESTLDQLSVPELMLLLLSAYLHDIGMSPSFRRFAGLRALFLEGDTADVRDKYPEVLTDDEIQQVYDWLDERQGGIDLPITGESPVIDLEKAEEILAYYCRDRHNDWSEEFIKTEVRSNAGDALYNNWLKDLTTLCISHHWDGLELKDECLDPRPIDNNKTIVNLRYLAAVLRLADVLENDPERTPDIVFKHRQIAKSSLVYWYKDHDFVLMLDAEDSVVTLRASPKDEKIHKALLETASQIEQELRACARLRFHANSLSERFTEHYQWIWPASMTTDIRPANDDYEFIDGAFRPDPTRVLELLGQEELYSSPLDAVRELIQNSSDAIHEMVARKRLRQGADRITDEDASVGLYISLRLEKGDDGRQFLVCEDNGVGMSKNILQQFFLVSGRSNRPDINKLSRKCEKQNIALRRTGRFGIGALSYFMIADQLEVTTRRSEFCDDADNITWVFKSDGLGDFGGLRRSSGSGAGTQIRLRIKESCQPQIEELEKFLTNTLVWLPCRFEFLIDGKENEAIAVASRGWSNSFILRLDKQDLFDDHGGEGHGWDEGLDADRRALRQATHKAAKCLTIEKAREWELPDNQGVVRIQPYFVKNDRGQLSAVYWEPDEQGHPSLLGVGQNAPIGFLQLRHRAQFAFRGMKIDLAVAGHHQHSSSESFQCIAEIDLFRVARISVSRSSAYLSSANYQRIKKFVEEKCKQAISEVLSDRAEPVTLGLTRAWAGLDFQREGAQYPILVNQRILFDRLIEPVSLGLGNLKRLVKKANPILAQYSLLASGRDENYLPPATWLSLRLVFLSNSYNARGNTDFLVSIRDGQAATSGSQAYATFPEELSFVDVFNSRQDYAYPSFENLFNQVSPWGLGKLREFPTYSFTLKGAMNVLWEAERASSDEEIIGAVKSLLHFGVTAFEPGAKAAKLFEESQGRLQSLFEKANLILGRERGAGYVIMTDTHIVSWQVDGTFSVEGWSVSYKKRTLQIGEREPIILGEEWWV